MQRTVREIKCDRCGKVIDFNVPEDFERVALNGAMYDLCLNCSSQVERALTSFKVALIRTFENREGYTDEK